MSRKRDRPYMSYRQDRPPFPKRRLPPPHQPADDEPVAKLPPPPALMITGLPAGCSVLDLKSRFEIYGPISRIRIERDGVGYVSFRSRDSGEAAVAASLDSVGISIDSMRLQVLWATDPLAKWREGVVYKGKRDNAHPPPSSSKLLRGELPLSRRGRGNKLASAIVNSRSSASDNSGEDNGGASSFDAPLKAREIVAYDDIL